METLKKFQEKLEQDTGLKTEYEALIKENDKDAIISFVKSHGVSDEDIEALKNGELGDDDLNEVTGGGLFSFNNPIFKVY